jgi:hypothetical protein
MPMDCGLARDYAARDGCAEEMHVTEAEWLAATNPRPMLEFFRAKSTDRKLLLLAVACCRRIWHLLADERCRHAVMISERTADGLATEADMREAAWQAWMAASEAAGRDRAQEMSPDPLVWQKDSAAAAWLTGMRGVTPNAAAKAVSCAAKAAARSAAVYGDPARESARRAEQVEQSNVVRDLFGNVFRPVPAVDPAWLAWKGGTVARLAQAAYDDRHLPEGTLELARLAALADALEDAGCTNAELLGHLRGPGPHVRGCWAVDLVLGKS